MIGVLFTMQGSFTVDMILAFQGFMSSFRSPVNFQELVPGSKIIKENGRWYKDKGILGADDWAGIALILELLDELRVNKFNGAIKVIFTVEEEKNHTIKPGKHIKN